MRTTKAIEIPQLRITVILGSSMWACARAYSGALMRYLRKSSSRAEWTEISRSQRGRSVLSPAKIVVSSPPSSFGAIVTNSSSARSSRRRDPLRPGPPSAQAGRASIEEYIYSKECT